MSGAEIPEQFGHYRITDRIGEGGMGVVYRAIDAHLEREVAIKVLPAGLLADEAARRRFRKEALALSRLNHPNIATVHDFATDAGADFLVMEFIPGTTIGDLIAHRSLPENEVARLGAQMAEGLVAAHEQHVIHCDLKPANLRLTTDGRVKILDFGLARLVRSGDADLTATVTASPATVTGTLPYMAPEQLRNDALDARTDIWAAGAVLYEMATGKLPFAEEGVRLIDAILHAAPVPPRLIAPRLSPALETVILKCLEKDPGSRYQSARELLVDLRHLAGPTSTVVAPAHSHTPRRWLPWALAAAALLAAITIAVALDLGGVRRRLAGGAVERPRIESVAVLPLANLSGDPGQDYFVDGMTDELITELSKIGSLKVISRTSVMRFKNTTASLPDIARTLSVDALIEGSVMRAGNRVRINAQLIHAATDNHLWADSFNRDMGDVLALSAEVTHAIAEQVRVKLTSQEQERLERKRSVVPDAYEAYLHGRFFMDRSQWEKAVGSFEVAVQRDPNFLPAWYGLSESAAMVDFDAGTRREKVNVEEAVDKVMALEPESAEAYVLRGDRKFYRHWDWSACDREFRRAVEVDPGFVDARYHYGLCLQALGKFDAALVEMQRAHELDPLAPMTNARLARALEQAGQPDRALEVYRKIAELEPEQPAAYLAMGRIDEEQGNIDGARRQYLEGLERSNFGPEQTKALRTVLEKNGPAAFRKKQLELQLVALNARAQREYVSPDAFAAAYAGLGHKDEAFKWLEKGFAERVPRLAWVKTGPAFAPLHSDPRFMDLLRRMKYPD